MTAPRNATSYQGQRHYAWAGQKLPSVTTILQSYPKPWLGAWAAKMVAEYAVSGNFDLSAFGSSEEAIRHLKGTPWRKRDDAADFGSALHEALAAHVAGRPMQVDPNAYAHANALSEWWDAYRPLVYDSEVQVFNLEHGYAGSLDLIAEVYGRRLLIDLKSGSAVGHDARLQLAAYRYAEFIGADDQRIAEVPSVDGCAVLWVPRDDPHSWQFIEVRAGASEYAVFLTLLQTHRFVNDNKDAGLGELILPQARMEVA